VNAGEPEKAGLATSPGEAKAQRKGRALDSGIAAPYAFDTRAKTFSTLCGANALPLGVLEPRAFKHCAIPPSVVTWAA
jgi:hypothetical protein